MSFTHIEVCSVIFCSTFRNLLPCSLATTATNSSGINFNVTEEQQEFIDLAEQFTKNEIIPVAAEYDRSGAYPWPVLKKAHETGLMNLHIPAEYGGMGLGTLVGIPEISFKFRFGFVNFF